MRSKREFWNQSPCRALSLSVPTPLPNFRHPKCVARPQPAPGWGRFSFPYRGPDLFRAACKFGLEGIVSKRRDRPYRAGR